MSLARDFVKGLALAHALPVVGLVVSVIVAAVGGVKLYGAHQRAVAFDKGYAFARDSAREATIVREIALRDSAAAAANVARQAAVDSTAKADSASARLRAVTERRRIVITADRSRSANVDTVPLVGVTSEASGKHWLLPRDAAMEWQETDSLLTLAVQLLDKYKAANVQWSRAYASEHEARLAADSALVLARQQTEPISPHSSTWHRSAALAALAFIAGAVVHHNVHIR